MWKVEIFTCHETCNQNPFMMRKATCTTKVRRYVSMYVLNRPVGAHRDFRSNITRV